MSKQLSEKQLKFIASYAGNATEAAEMAGYSDPRRTGSVLMKHPDICRQIKERQIEEATPLIASRQERQKFWTDTMRDQVEDIKNRLKASEHLGKSEADFVDRQEHSGPGGAPLLVNVNIKGVAPGA